MWVFFLWFEIILAAVMMSFTLDVSHAFKVRAMLQGAADAATLAGAFQNHEEIRGFDQYGAPITYEYVLNYDTTPEDKAREAWDKNVYNFTEGAGFGVVPQFTRTWDNKGITCTVTQTVQMTVSQTVMNKIFGAGSAPQVNIRIPVQSTSKVVMPQQ